MSEVQPRPQLRAVRSVVSHNQRYWTGEHLWSLSAHQLKLITAPILCVVWCNHPISVCTRLCSVVLSHQTSFLHLLLQMVSDEYNDLFAGQVVSVQPVHETTKLEKLVTKYGKTSQKLWDVVGDYSNKKRNGKKIKRKQVRANSIWCGTAA